MANFQTGFCLARRSLQFREFLLLYASIFLFLVLPPLCSSQLLFNIPLNSSVEGTTVNASIGLFTKFRIIDRRKPRVGLGGQRLFQLDIPVNSSDIDISISTCEGSDFDTYIALLDNNPELQLDAIALSESSNDIDCEADKNRAFLTTKLSPGLYFILITGDGNQEGNFTMSVKGNSPTPPPVPWGLDRIDQRRLPLDGVYDVIPTGERVWVYLIDSGVRTTHEEFEGRAVVGYDFVNNREASAPDCTGHGTHVAGIIAGKTYGVSKRARLVSVRAFDCNNTARISAIVDSLGWALLDARFKERINVVVAVMFSTAAMQSSTLQSAILGLQRSGIPVIIPAGNNEQDACGFYPGSLGSFLSVGSTGPDDTRSQFSNYGNCTKLYAPGESIVSSWHNSDTSWRTFSGTTQAAAHVVGVVSNLMNLNPRIKGEIVYDIMKSVSTLNVVKDDPVGKSTRLAFVRSVPEFTGISPPPKKEVFLFVVLKFKVSSCSEETDENTKNMFAESLLIKASRVQVECDAKTVSRSEADSKIVEVRFQLAERTAVADFALLESLFLTGKTGLEEKLGLSFDVLEEPWVVDSTMTVFWGTPSFSETESSRLSSGAIAGIVVGVLFALSVILLVSWLLYRRYAKLDEVQSMEGSGDYAKGPVQFDARNNEDGSSSSMMRSFRDVVKSMNFRRSRSGVHTEDKGMNRMGSFIGKIGGEDGDMRETVGQDMVRVDSYGAEAFAQLTDNFGRSLSKESRKAPSSDEDVRSFRGPKGRKSGHSDFAKGGVGDIEGMEVGEGGAADVESLRMKSLGGEAFAMFAMQASEEKEGLKTDGVDRDDERDGKDDLGMQTESYEAEVVVDFSGDEESSFFNELV